MLNYFSLNFIIRYNNKLYSPINKIYQKLYTRLNNYYSNNLLAASAAGFIAATISGIAALV